MATTTNAVVAFFSSEAKAAQAIDALNAAGFQAREIGAATNTGYGTSETESGATGSTGSAASSMGSTVAGVGSTVAAKTEGVWDKMKNFFEGGTSEGGVEQYADERAGDRSSHEVTRGGAVASGAYDDYEPADISHSLTGMQIPESRSRYFEQRFNAGHSGVLVTVSAAGREAEAERILTQYDGDLGNDTARYDTTAATTATTPVAGQQRIQLLGEVLRVHKDRVSRGEVRIRKEVITEQQTVQVPVTREELVIERLPVTGQTTATGAIGDSSEIRIPLSEEHASAETQTFVREEIAVGKRAVENVEQVGGAVRREELEIEDQTVGSTTATRTR